MRTPIFCGPILSIPRLFLRIGVVQPVDPSLLPVISERLWKGHNGIQEPGGHALIEERERNPSVIGKSSIFQWRTRKRIEYAAEGKQNRSQQLKCTYEYAYEDSTLIFICH